MLKILSLNPAPEIRDYWIAAVTFVGIAVCFSVDTLVTHEQQIVLGIGGWICLLGLLKGEDTLTRTQVGIAVLFATIGEHFASPYMEGYTYRFGDVSDFVPPGHGMVYLTAIALGRSGFFRQFQSHILVFVLIVGSIWSIWDVTLAERGDEIGALLFFVFVMFVFFGRSPMVYLGAFFITTWVEFIGTYLGTWNWAVIDPASGLSQGNPPSGVAAWYCLVDAIAISTAPKVMHSFAWLNERYRLLFQN